MKITLDDSNAVTVKMLNPSALDQLKEQYLNIQELSVFLGMENKRIRDLISLHKKNGEFMTAYKVSAGHYLFHIDDILAYIQANSTISETFNTKED